MLCVDLRGLQDVLQRMPAMVEVDPLSLAFLPDEIHVYQDAWELAAELDSPTVQATRPMLATQIEPALRHRLPAVRCDHDPLTTALNRVLLKRYDFVRASMLCQSQVASEIARCADTDPVVLVLVDGLSYADLKQYAVQWLTRTTPVLVDGVSITEHGMVRLVGDPPLALRLFDRGLRSCLGFAYWERAEQALTDRLFRGFGNRVRKVRSFDEVLKSLEGAELQGAFVQIVREGLDEVAHRHREAPNVAEAVTDILTDFERLADVFSNAGIGVQLYLVSDHGILWAQEHSFQAYEFAGADHTRHYEHAKHGKHALTVEFGGKEFAMLEYPYLRRNLRANEWGVHGGLSFEESVVPLVSLSIA